MLVRKLSDKGDTFVEVLLAIAIVSFILVAAYATANKNTLLNQDTQERSQALQIATSQLELLRNAVSVGTSVTSSQCFATTGNVVNVSDSGAPCTVKADGTPAGGSLPAYMIAISAGATYSVNVSWDSLASNTRSSVTLYYQP